MPVREQAPVPVREQAPVPERVLALVPERVLAPELVLVLVLVSVRVLARGQVPERLAPLSTKHQQVSARSPQAVM